MNTLATLTLQAPRVVLAKRLQRTTGRCLASRSRRFRKSRNAEVEAGQRSSIRLSDRHAAELATCHAANPNGLNPRPVIPACRCQLRQLADEKPPASARRWALANVPSNAASATSRVGSSCTFLSAFRAAVTSCSDSLPDRSKRLRSPERPTRARTVTRIIFARPYLLRSDGPLESSQVGGQAGVAASARVARCHVRRHERRAYGQQRSELACSCSCEGGARDDGSGARKSSTAGTSAVPADTLLVTQRERQGTGRPRGGQ
jgi:hypothetical protein